MNSLEIDGNNFPNDWRIVSLGSVCTIQGGYAFKSNDFEDEGIPVIRISNITDSGIDVAKKSVCVKQASKAVIEQFRLNRGDILVALSGATTGKYGVFQSDELVLVNQRVGRIRSENKSALSKYVFYYMGVLQSQILNKAYGAAQPNISTKEISEFQIPLPPLAQQKQIVAKIEELFSHIDAGIVALQKAKQLLKQYRQSVLKAAVTGELTREWREQNKDKLEPASELLKRILAERRIKWEEQQLQRFKKNSKLPKNDKWKESFQEPYSEYEAFCDIPETWCWATIEQLGDVQLGRQRSPKNRSDKYPTKYIRAANITEDGLDLKDLLDMEFKPDEFDRYVMKENDLILSEASGSPDQVGKPAIWRKNMPICCFQNTVIRHRPCGVAAEYLLIHYKYFYWCQIFSKTAGGVGINHLSSQKFSKLSISLPPLDEQKVIVHEVDRSLNALNRLEDEINAKLKKSDIFKQSILSVAFSGKLANNNG